ncbi:hypothetical protein GIB67_019756, partial [Kingdonia uniflora]
DQIVPFVSSIFLGRLLQPGVHQNAALSATIQDFNKHWTESEFQSLTVDGLKKELFSLIERARHIIVDDIPVHPIIIQDLDLGATATIPLPLGQG